MNISLRARGLRRWDMFVVVNPMGAPALPRDLRSHHAAEAYCWININV